MRLRHALFVASLALPSTALASRGDDEFERHPPQIGHVAPPLGGLGWLQLDPEAGGKAPDLAALRGKVVVVTTYGYYCDSCVRSGVPTANALRDSNPNELCVISFTGPWGEESQEKTVEEARKLGIRHAIGWASYFGEDTPYLDMLEHPSLTFAYVITRSGGVLWKGDASAKRDDYLEAVSAALAQPTLAPLEGAYAPELAPALDAYIRADLGATNAALASVLKKLGSKSTPEAQQARADAQKLQGLVETSRKMLMDELERCGGAGDGEKFQKLMPQVRKVFGKGAEIERCDALEMYIAVHTDQGPANRAWAQWYELAARRPANFPAEKDKHGQKFARDLAKHLKEADAKGVKQIEEWLRLFDAAPTRK